MCQSGILPVFRTNDVRNLYPASKAFYDAGIGCVEYTMTMPGALDLVREGTASLPKDLLLGAGTVMDGADRRAGRGGGGQVHRQPRHQCRDGAACNEQGVVSVVARPRPAKSWRPWPGRRRDQGVSGHQRGAGLFRRSVWALPRDMPDGGRRHDAAKSPNYVVAGAKIVTLLGNGLDPAAYAAGDRAAITRAATKWVEAVLAARLGK